MKKFLIFLLLGWVPNDAFAHLSAAKHGYSNCFATAHAWSLIFPLSF